MRYVMEWWGIFMFTSYFRPCASLQNVNKRVHYVCILKLHYDKGRSHSAAMLASRLQWTMRRNVRTCNMHTATSKNKQKYARGVCCDVSVTLFQLFLYVDGNVTIYAACAFFACRIVIVDWKQAWPLYGISVLCEFSSNNWPCSSSGIT